MKFRAPGPELRRDEQPRLFEDLEKIAKAAGQRMPKEVYLLPEVNAWVSQRGGVMGFGATRMMGLGLPLLHTLTRSQLRAVLAHEFGHYHGDTQLGPWIYQTRSAMARTVNSLRTIGGRAVLVRLPFLLYGNIFLRISQAVSRHQELVADRLAARIAGPKPMIESLRTIHGMSPAFEAYWANEYSPVLDAGLRPPIVEGFAMFVQARPVAEAIRRQGEDDAPARKSNPYDTHPPLKERIRAVLQVPVGNATPDDSPASALLQNVPVLEGRLLELLMGKTKAARLRAVSWTDVGMEYHSRRWTTLVKINATALQGITPENLPAAVADMKKFCRRFEVTASEEYRRALAASVVGAAVALLLVQRGWQPRVVPGAAVVLQREHVQFEPFDIISTLGAGTVTAEAWQHRCAELGIQGLDLGKVAKSEARS